MPRHVTSPVPFTLPIVLTTIVIEMNLIEELNTSRNLLNLVVDRYLSACSAIRDYCACESPYDDAAWREDARSCAASELDLFSTYTTRMYQAKAALDTTRNHSSRIVPISALPFEILSRIFSLVHGELVYPGYSSDNTFILSRYPNLLSSVCSRWRRVVIGTHALWLCIHIDPGRRTGMSNETLARIEAYAARSGQLPLQVYVGNSLSGSTKHEGEDLVRFLASVSGRIGSLELYANASRKIFFSSMLRGCFLKAFLGVLTRLDLTFSGNNFLQHSVFIEAAESPHHTESVLIDLPEQFLEDLWFFVSILQLYGTFPRWTSKAYHNLVELQLSSPRTGTMSITEFQLAAILASSPGLRIFYFDVELRDFGLLAASVGLVRLEALEEIGLGSLQLGQIGAILRLIVPGVKRLQLTLRMAGALEADELSNDIKNFFARSNISKLRVHRAMSLFQVSEFCRLSPHLQVFVLDGCSNSPVVIIPPFPDAHHDPRAIDRSGTQLYLLHCRIRLSDLQWMLRRHPTHTLTLWRTEVLQDGGQEHGPADLEILAQDCPVVNLLQYGDPKPTPGWYQLFTDQ